MTRSTTQEQALQVAELLLRPLIRLLTHHGAGLNDLVELSKRIYVEQAEKRLQQDGRRVTDAALSTMTGVHRKDVKRINDERAGQEPVEKRKHSLLDLVMTLWSGDARFIDGRGAPRPLARRLIGSETTQASFEDLIEAVTKGVPPKALLDSWIQQGAVRLDELGRVCWADPERAAGEELQALARTAHLAADRVNAAWDELYGKGGQHFLFSVRGVQLLPEDVRQLNEQVRRWGRRFGDRLNKAVTTAQAHGRKHGGDQRFSFGIQSYAETQPVAASEAIELGEA